MYMLQMRLKIELLFLDILCLVLQKCINGEYLILGGNFNFTEQDIDRNHLEPHMLSRERLIQLTKTHELSDIWRTFHEKGYRDSYS